MKNIYLSLICLYLLSCSQIEPGSSHTNNSTNSLDEFIIEPSMITQSTSRSESRMRALPTDNNVEWLLDENILKYLGTSIEFTGSDLNKEKRQSVINVRTLIADKSLENAITLTSARNLIIKSSAYRDYLHTRKEDRYYKKYSGGFSIGFLGLKLVDFTSTHEKTFYEKKDLIKTSMFGEANVEYTGYVVSLSKNNSTLVGIMEKHLSPGFIRSLFNDPMGAVSQGYSPLILRGYSTGGRMVSKYMLHSTSTTHQDSTLKHFDAGLTLNFKPTQKDNKKPGESVESIGGNIGYNKNSFNTHLSEEEYDNLYTSIQTIGGSPDLQVHTPVMKAKEAPESLDISSWLKSLSERKNQEIIDIEDNGLIPISNFIVEENFKRRLVDIHKGVFPPNMVIVDPKIEATRVFIRNGSSGQPVSDLALVLNTRNGDKIILTRINEEASEQELSDKYNSKAKITQRAKELRQSFGLMFKGVEMSGNLKKVLYPYLRSPLTTFAVCDFKNMRKYQNPYTNVLYLYDDSSRIAFSVYNGPEGDYDAIKYYGLAEFIDSLPEKVISLKNLSENYKVIGL